MKQFFQIKRISIGIVVLITLFITPIIVSAASTIAVNGTAEVVSTGGSFLFDTNNSNVTVDSATGDMTGFVWSEELGWVDFDNNGGSDPAKVSLTTGRITGLAYTSNTGGAIDFTNYNSNVMVDLSSGGISGYAWSEDVGWIDFSSARVSGSLLSLVKTGQNLIPILLGAGLILGASIFFAKKGQKVKD